MIQRQIFVTKITMLHNDLYDMSVLNNVQRFNLQVNVNIWYSLFVNVFKYC